MEFHNKLYNLRKQKGLSQEELANRLNVSRQTISKWEAGQTTPELEKLRNLAKLFNISVDAEAEEYFRFRHGLYVAENDTNTVYYTLKKKHRC